MFKIGDFSKLSNVSVRMLRYYEKMGLLFPDNVDQFSGYRYYLAAQLETVGRIQKLKSLGFSLAVIRKMLSSEDFEELKVYFEIRQKELKEEFETITAQANMLDSVKQILRKDAEMMNYSVVLKEIPERFVVSIRRVVPGFSDEGKLWSELYDECQKQTVQYANSPLAMTIYHDKEYKEEDMDIEVQSAVEGAYSNTEAVAFFKAQALQVASVTFRGSYDQMPKVTETIAQWIEDNDYQISGPMMNIFHVSPAMDKHPDNWVTEACFQVEEAAGRNK